MTTKPRITAQEWIAYQRLCTLAADKAADPTCEPRYTIDDLDPRKIKVANAAGLGSAAQKAIGGMTPAQQRADSLADQVVEAVRGFVDARQRRQAQRIDELERRLKALEKERSSEHA